MIHGLLGQALNAGDGSILYHKAGISLHNMLTGHEKAHSLKYFLLKIRRRKDSALDVRPRSHHKATRTK